MYKTIRTKAWRNLLVATINEGLARGLIGLKEDENHWKDTLAFKDTVTFDGQGGVTFDFEISGMPAAGYFLDMSGDVLVDAALYPRRSFDTGFKAGDLSAEGRFGRRQQPWLMSDGWKSFSFRRDRQVLIGRAARLVIEPRGFVDHGRLT